MVTKEAYDEVGRGKVNLRCHASAVDATPLWQKGERLAENTIAFFLNMDPAYGFWEDFEFYDGGSSEPRSEPRQVDGAGRSWNLRINSTHPAYLRTEDDEQRRRDYMFEEMARQTIGVLLRLGHEDVLAKLANLGTSEHFNELSNADVLEKIAYRVVDGILAVNYAG